MTPAPDSLRARLREGARVVGTFVKSRDPAIAEILAVTGYDFVIADLEHSSLALADVENIVRACGVHGVPVLARVAPAGLGLAGPLLDAGVTGIQVSDVTSADAACAAQEAVRYPPAGSRSLSVATPAARYGSASVAGHLAAAAAETVLVGQIESATGVSALGTIITSGVFDALFLGVTDLSVSLGHPGAPGDPEVAAAMEQASEEIAGSGMPFGVFCGNADQARSWAGRGASMLVIGSDYALLAGTAAETVRRAGRAAREEDGE